jgi:hypothetical protein
MPRILTALFVLTTILFTACGGDSVSGCSEHIWTGKFGICIGKDWEQVSEEKLKEEGVPAETLAAFQIKDQRAGQRDNIVVSRERLPSAISALSYAETNVNTIEATPDYALIEKRSVKIDGEKTLLHVFTARPVPDLPARRFYQLSLVDGNRGYVFTGTLPFSVDEEVENGIIEMMLSGTLKEN